VQYAIILSIAVAKNVGIRHDSNSKSLFWCERHSRPVMLGDRALSWVSNSLFFFLFSFFFYGGF